MVRTSTKATILAAVMAAITLLQGVQAYPRSELRLPRGFYRGEPNCAAALDGWTTDLEVNYLVPLNKLWDKKAAEGAKPDRNGESACQCKKIPGETNGRSFDWGCSRCIGKVRVGVSHCYDFLD